MTANQKAIRHLAWLVAIWAIWLGVHLSYTLYRGLQEFDGQARWGLVMGNQVLPGGHVSTHLQERLDCALELYRHGQVKALLLSGGIGVEGENEARAMARYLQTQGIPDSVLFQDSTGRSTYSSALYAQEILDLDSPLVLVSHPYHLLRCELAMKRVGFREVASAAPAFTWSFRQVWGLLREWPAYYYYLLRPWPTKRQAQ